jgi:hypothetical protein
MAKQPLRKVTVIQPDGTITITLEPNPNYDRLKTLVHGYIEYVPDFARYNGLRVNAVVCNENAKLRPAMEPNPVATKAWRNYLDSTKRPYIRDMARLSGPVVIIQSPPKTNV